jgi:TRAP-type C4-dicarboxylate transport system permease small subunit
MSIHPIEQKPALNGNVNYKAAGLFTPFVVTGFLAMALIPLVMTLGRWIPGITIPGAAGWVQHLTLWLGLLGGILATMRGRHLSVAVIHMFNFNNYAPIINLIAGAGAVGILLCLTSASVDLVIAQYPSPENLAGWFPIWLAQAFMPAGFFTMAVATVFVAAKNWRTRLVLIGLALLIGPVLALLP